MAKAKRKTPKKAELMPFPSLPTSWADIDRTFENFRRDLERTFHAFPTIQPPTIPTLTFPKIATTSCDIIDEGDKFRVRADMPGVKKSDIELNITDNSVEISAEHKEEEEERKKNFLRKERSEVSYYRTLALPEKVVSEKAKAKLIDGILNIVVPKARPTPKPKKTSITVQ